jgi:hypothetical protein
LRSTRLSAGYAAIIGPSAKTARPCSAQHGEPHWIAIEPNSADTLDTHSLLRVSNEEPAGVRLRRICDGRQHFGLENRYDTCRIQWVFQQPPRRAAPTAPFRMPVGAVFLVHLTYLGNLQLLRKHSTTPPLHNTSHAVAIKMGPRNSPRLCNRPPRQTAHATRNGGVFYIASHWLAQPAPSVR